MAGTSLITGLTLSGTWAFIFSTRYQVAARHVLASAPRDPWEVNSTYIGQCSGVALLGAQALLVSMVTQAAIVPPALWATVDVLMLATAFRGTSCILYLQVLMMLQSILLRCAILCALLIAFPSPLLRP